MAIEKLDFIISATADFAKAQQELKKLNSAVRQTEKSAIGSVTSANSGMDAITSRIQNSLVKSQQLKNFSKEVDKMAKGVLKAGPGSKVVAQLSQQIRDSIKKSSSGIASAYSSLNSNMAREATKFAKSTQDRILSGKQNKVTVADLIDIKKFNTQKGALTSQFGALGTAATLKFAQGAEVGLKRANLAQGFLKAVIPDKSEFNKLSDKLFGTRLVEEQRRIQRAAIIHQNFLRQSALRAQEEASRGVGRNNNDFDTTDTMRKLITAKNAAQATIRELQRQRASAISAVETRAIDKEIASVKRKLPQTLANEAPQYAMAAKRVGIYGAQLTAATNKTIKFYVESEIAVNTLRRLSSSMWVLSMGLKQAANAMTYSLTIPLGLAGGAALKTAADFEHANAMITAAVGRGAGQNFTKVIDDQVKALSLNLPSSMAEIQEAMLAAAQAGVTDQAASVEEAGDALTEYTSVLMKLKAVEGDYAGSTKDLAERVSKVAYAYGFSWEQIKNLASGLREASASTTGGLEDIMSSLVRASASAGIFNISLGDTLGLLMTLLPTSGSAARAGTQLSNIYQKMVSNLGKDTDKSKKTISELATFMQMSSKDVKDALDKDAAAFFGAYLKQASTLKSAVDTTSLSVDIFGEDTSKVVNQLIPRYEDLRKNVERVNKEIESGTRLDRDFSVVANTLKGTMTRAWNAIKILAIEVGESFKGVIVDILDTLIAVAVNIASVWKAIPAPIQKVVGSMLALAAVAGPLLRIFTFLFIEIRAGFITAAAMIGRLAITTGALAKSAITAGLGQRFLANSTKAASGQMLLFGATSTAASGGLFRMMGAATGLSTTLRSLVAFIAPAIRLLGILGVMMAGVGIAYKRGWFGLGSVQKQSASMYDKLKKTTSLTKDMLKTRTPGTAELPEGLGGGGGSDEKDKLIKIAGDWGDAFVERYTKSFSELDSETFRGALDIASQVFEEMEKLGEISGEKMYQMNKDAQELIAKSILDVKKLGKVGSGTKKELESLIGKNRTSSIIKYIKQSIQVDKLEDALENVQDSLETLKEKSEKAVEGIQDQIDASNTAFDKEKNPIEKAIRQLSLSIRALQETSEAELQPLKDKVEAQEEYLDDVKDQYDAEKEVVEEYIDTLERQKDVIEDNVDDLEDTIDALEKLRKKEVDAAEGMVEYHKMNFDAANRQLDMETSMGKDEFNASWRAAKMKAKAADEQVTLAENHLARIEHSYDKEIELNQDKVDVLEESLKGLDDQIEAQEDILQAIEDKWDGVIKGLEKQLKLDEKILDTREKYWEKQIDALEKQEELESNRLSDMEYAHDEYISTLEAEKEALKDKYDAEIAIEQEKVDAAQKSLDAAKSSLDTLKKINQQLLEDERARIGAERAPGEATGGAGGGGGGGLGDMDFGELEDGAEGFTSALDDLVDTLQTSEDVGPGWFDKFATASNDAFTKFENNINERIKPSIERLKEALRDFGLGFDIPKLNITSFTSYVGKSLSNMFDGVARVIGSIAQLFLGLGEVIVGISQGDWKLAFTGMKDVGVSSLNGLLGATEIIFPQIATTFDGQTNAMKEQIKNWEEYKVGATSSALEMRTGVGNHIWWMGQKMDEDLKNSSIVSYNTFKKFTKDTTDAALNLNNNIVGEDGSITNATQSIEEQFQNTNLDSQQSFRELTAGVKTGAENLKSNTVGKSGSITQTREGIDNSFNGLWDSNKEQIEEMTRNTSSALGEIKKAGDEIDESNKSWISNLAKYLKDSYSTISTWAGKIGDAILGINKEAKAVNKNTGGVAKSYNAGGGLIYANSGYFKPRGTDVIPAMLTPGEMVLNKSQQERLFAILNGTASLQVPVVNTGVVTPTASSAGYNNQVSEIKNVTQNSGNTYNINTGTMIASQGEVREFVRLISKYLAVENQRTI